MEEIDLINKLKWQCRRGMLELDVVLIPFLEQHFNQLSKENKKLFEQLLEQADPDIYTWIMGYGECNQAALVPIIDLIRNRMAIA